MIVAPTLSTGHNAERPRANGAVSDVSTIDLSPPAEQEKGVPTPLVRPGNGRSKRDASTMAHAYALAAELAQPVARGDLTQEIAALKSEPGGDIIAHGGAAFVQALSRLGLIDEYRLVILPVALGNGLPLFKVLTRPLRVDLAEAKSFPDGTVIHVYQPITTTNT